MEEVNHDRIQAASLFFNSLLGGTGKYQTACATVSVPSSLVSCVCNTFARPTLVSLRRVRRVMRENVARYGAGKPAKRELTL